MSGLPRLAFDKAFNFSMKYEVGPFFDANDPEVIAGLCQTKAQKRKTGYVNDPLDAGGETKFGIAKTANPNIDIKTLTLAEAKDIYFRKYWLAGRCNEMASELVAICHFDACINHGVRGANKLLQRALGVNDDGIIGDKTINAVKNADQQLLLDNLLKERKTFFKNLAIRKPTQNRFLNGWLARVESIESYLETEIV